jgi:acrylyl-CoA reductase (NADPH)
MGDDAGGYAQRQRVHAEHLVHRRRMSSLDATTIGTAGLTAMLCVAEIEDAGITPDDGPIVVTGAAGGWAR